MTNTTSATYNAYEDKAAVEDMVNRYMAVRGDEFTDEQRAAVVTALAEQYGKTDASIRGKLYREQRDGKPVYRAKTYKTKRGNPAISKAQLVDDLANLLGVVLTDQEGSALEKANKSGLTKLIAGAQALHDEIDLVDVPDSDDVEDEDEEVEVEIEVEVV